MYSISELSSKLARAVDARRSLAEDPATTAYRLVNGEGDGLPGVAVDWFDGVCVLSLYQELSRERELEWVEALARAVPARAIYLKRRPKEARHVANTAKAQVAPEKPEWGDPVEEHPVLEAGLNFLIRPAQGLSVGLYLDMRPTRVWLRANARGAEVLNCFAYTCAFGVAATAGGARRVVNVDLSRRVLDWGEENARRNAQPTRREDYLSGDVFEWLARLAKKGQRFDRVVLDPPSFATAGKRRFSAGADYPKLVEAAAPLVGRQGILIACCNLASLSMPRFRAAVDEGLSRAGRRGREVVELSASGVDFPEIRGLQLLKVLALELR